MAEAKSEQEDRVGSVESVGHDGWTGIDHVPLAIPVGGEPAARRFFVDLAGFVRCRVDDPFGNRIELIEAAP